MGQVTVSFVVKTSKEPSAIFRIHKEAFGTANVRVLRHGPNFGAAVTRSCLRRPHADFPTIVKNEASGTTVLKNGVIVFVLVEFYAPIELRTVLRVAIVALSGTFKDRFAFFSDASNFAFSIDDSDNPGWGNVNADGAQCLRGCNEVLFEAVNNELTRLPVQLGHGLENGLQERKFALAADIVNVVGVNTEQGYATQVTQYGVLGLDDQTGCVIKGHP